jgi:hypothetical protein
MHDVQDVFGDSNQAKRDQVTTDSENMLGLLSCESIWSTTIDPKQVRIVFFIAGYVSRSAMKSTACSGCKGMLSKSNDLTHLQFEEPGTSAEKEAREEYVSLINRGGLVSPSDLVYVTCVRAIQLNQFIFGNKETKEAFLFTTVPRTVFVNVFLELLKKTVSTERICQQKCKSGHMFSEFLTNFTSSVFNIVSKNFVSELNDVIHEARKHSFPPKSSKNVRKIAKLQSNSSTA